MEDCIKVGLGQLRLDPAAFYDMLFSDFQIAAEGFYELEELRQQAHWERSRWVACLTLSPHAKKGHRIKPTDLAIFPWEKKPKSKADNRLLKNALKGISHGKT